MVVHPIPFPKGFDRKISAYFMSSYLILLSFWIAPCLPALGALCVTPVVALLPEAEIQPARACTSPARSETNTR